MLLSPLYSHAAWAVPLQAPPLGNSEAPLSTSSDPQIKNGDLIVGAFAAFMDSLFQKKLGIGKVPSIYSTLDVNPTITLTDSLKNIQSGITYTGLTAMTNYYGTYIAAPAGSGIITNKYALVTEPTAGKVGIGTITPASALSVAGGIQVADDTGACTTAKAGTVRWHNTVMEVCTGAAWVNITNAGGCQASGGCPVGGSGATCSTYFASSVINPSTCTMQSSVCSDSSWYPTPFGATTCTTRDEISGCTDSDACNYNPSADVSNGSCILPGESCSSEPNNCNERSGGSIRSNCTCDAVPPPDKTVACIFGCTDSGANNYNWSANTDDGSCTYDGDNEE